MNRTAIFLAAAGVLALIGLIIGLPRLSPNPTPNTVRLCDRAHGGDGILSPNPTPNTVTTVGPIAKAVSSDGSIKMSARLSHPLVYSAGQDLFATVDLAGVDVP